MQSLDESASSRVRSVGLRSPGGRKWKKKERLVQWISMPMTPKACLQILECLEICTLVHGGEDLPPYLRTPARLSEVFSGTKESPILMTPRRQPR